MDINNNLQVQSLTIETMYNYYKSNKLIVNRRYQRKLVWTVEEKEAFIDSISINYPVPIFLVAEVVRPAYFMLELEPQLYTFIFTLFPLVV